MLPHLLPEAWSKSQSEASLEFPSVPVLPESQTATTGEWLYREHGSAGYISCGNAQISPRSVCSVAVK